MKKGRKRQARKSGQVIPKGDRKWLVRAHVGAGKYASKLIRGTFKQAEAGLRKLQTEIEAGSHVAPVREALGPFLTRWLDTEKRLQVSARTHEGYCGLVNRSVIPAIGAIRLDQVQHSDIQGLDMVRRESKEAVGVHLDLQLCEKPLSEPLEAPQPDPWDF